MSKLTEREHSEPVATHRSGGIPAIRFGIPAVRSTWKVTASCGKKRRSCSPG